MEGRQNPAIKGGEKMALDVIATEKALAAVGPYSQAITALDNFILIQKMENW